LVRAGGREQQYPVRLGVTQVDYRGQPFVVDVDQFHRVFTLVLLFSDHHGYRLTDVAHYVAGQHRLDHLGVHLGHHRFDERQVAEVSRRIYRQHSGRGQGRGGIDAGDPGVRDR
jgi:hypothetical protein